MASNLVRLKDGRIIDLLKLKEFSYYAPNILRIKAENPRRIIPFLFNSEQQRLHETWERQLSQTGMVRLIILKDRRIGCSTYVDGRSYHQVTTIPNTSAFVVTHDKQSLSKIFGMSKLFWEETPPQLRPMTKYNNSTVLDFQNPNKKERLVNPGLRSLMEVFSAGTGTATRSGGYSIAHFSEVAFYEKAEELITSTVPSVQDLPGTVKVFESTGNGRSGYFYEQWKKAVASQKPGVKRKLSIFEPLFFGWLSFKEYSKPFLSPQFREDLIDTLDEEEVFLRNQRGATLEQLNWRRDKILEFNDNVETFQQEYPCTPEEAFIARGTPYWPKRTLLRLRNLCQPPRWIGECDEIGFHENEEGFLSIWEKPIEGEEYVLSADVGEGGEGGDPSTIQVLKVPKGTPRIKQVAEWKGLIDPVMFAVKLTTLANWYNEGLVAPETHSAGLTTIAELKMIYSNIYQWEFIDRFKNALSNKLGWETNQSTKPHLCNYLSACLAADGVLEINSERLIDEMLSFVRNTTGSGEADYNCQDDLIMAYMIGVFIVGRTSQVGSLIQQLGLYKEKVTVEVREERLTSLDHDLEDYHYGGEVVESGDRSWLNY